MNRRSSCTRDSPPIKTITTIIDKGKKKREEQSTPIYFRPRTQKFLAAFAKHSTCLTSQLVMCGFLQQENIDNLGNHCRLAVVMIGVFHKRDRNLFTLGLDSFALRLGLHELFHWCRTLKLQRAHKHIHTTSDAHLSPLALSTHTSLHKYTSAPPKKRRRVDLLRFINMHHERLFGLFCGREGHLLLSSTAGLLVFLLELLGLAPILGRLI